MEVLGYHKLNDRDRKYFESFFRLCKLISISNRTIELAIKLRQKKSMTLGDSIIAATAEEMGLTLVTANNKDFEHIESLTLVNPLI